MEKPDKILGFEEQVAVCLRDISPKKLTMQSDVDDEEIPNLCVLYVLDKNFKINVLKEFADNFLELRISRFRLGRREIIGLGTGVAEPERRKLKTLRDLFVGIR
ncbi:MAG: hypothetical protein QXF61_04350 [Nitrososphaeria archaeon]